MRTFAMMRDQFGNYLVIERNTDSYASNDIWTSYLDAGSNYDHASEVIDALNKVHNV